MKASRGIWIGVLAYGLAAGAAAGERTIESYRIKEVFAELRSGAPEAIDRVQKVIRRLDPEAWRVFRAPDGRIAGLEMKGSELSPSMSVIEGMRELYAVSRGEGHEPDTVLRTYLPRVTGGFRVDADRPGCMGTLTLHITEEPWRESLWEPIAAQPLHVSATSILMAPLQVEAFGQALENGRHASGKPDVVRIRWGRWARFANQGGFFDVVLEPAPCVDLAALVAATGATDRWIDRPGDAQTFKLPGVEIFPDPTHPRCVGRITALRDRPVATQPKPPRADK